LEFDQLLETLWLSMATSTINNIKATAVPWVLRVQGRPLVSMVPASPLTPMVITKTTASPTTINFGDFISYLSSMAARDLLGLG
jgi:hypothetical protein